MENYFQNFIPKRITGAERKKIEDLLLGRIYSVTWETALARASAEQKQELTQQLSGAKSEAERQQYITDFAAGIPGLADAIENAVERELLAIQETMGWK